MAQTRLLATSSRLWQTTLPPPLTSKVLVMIESLLKPPGAPSSSTCPQGGNIQGLFQFRAETTQRRVKVVVQGNGVIAYKIRKWDLAIELFASALKIVPDDGPSKTYIERCKDYIEIPPPENWSGIYELKTK